MTQDGELSISPPWLSVTANAFTMPPSGHVRCCTACSPRCRVLFEEEVWCGRPCFLRSNHVLIYPAPSVWFSSLLALLLQAIVTVTVCVDAITAAALNSGEVC